MINNLIIYKFFKDFTNHRKKTNRVVVLSSRPFMNILKYRDYQRDYPIIWKTRLSDTYWRFHLVCTKFQAHSSSEPPVKYYQDRMPLMNQGSLWPFEPFHFHGPIYQSHIVVSKMSCGRYISHQHLHKKNLIFLVLVAEPATWIAAKASRTIFLLIWINFNKEDTFLCKLS